MWKGSITSLVVLEMQIETTPNEHRCSSLTIPSDGIRHIDGNVAGMSGGAIILVNNIPLPHVAGHVCQLSLHSNQPQNFYLKTKPMPFARGSALRAAFTTGPLHAHQLGHLHWGLEGSCPRWHTHMASKLVPAMG